MRIIKKRIFDPWPSEIQKSSPTALEGGEFFFIGPGGLTLFFIFPFYSICHILKCVSSIVVPLLREQCDHFKVILKGSHFAVLYWVLGMSQIEKKVGFRVVLKTGEINLSAHKFIKNGNKNKTLDNMKYSKYRYLRMKDYTLTEAFKRGSFHVFL